MCVVIIWLKPFFISLKLCPPLQCLDVGLWGFQKTWIVKPNGACQVDQRQNRVLFEFLSPGLCFTAARIPVAHSHVGQNCCQQKGMWSLDCKQKKERLLNYFGGCHAFLSSCKFSWWWLILGIQMNYIQWEGNKNSAILTICLPCRSWKVCLTVPNLGFKRITKPQRGFPPHCVQHWT